HPTASADITSRGLNDVPSPFELVCQRALPQRPGFQLGAHLLLLFAEKLQPAFELTKLGVDRDPFPVKFLAPLLPGRALRLHAGLCLTSGTLAVRRGLQRRIRSLELNPGGLNRAGQFINYATTGLFRGHPLPQLALPE